MEQKEVTMEFAMKYEIPYAQVRQLLIEDLKKNNLSPKLISIFDEDPLFSTYYLVEGEVFFYGEDDDELSQIKDYYYDEKLGLCKKK